MDIVIIGIIVGFVLSNAVNIANHYESNIHDPLIYVFKNEEKDLKIVFKIFMYVWFSPYLLITKIPFHKIPFKKIFYKDV